MSTRLGSLRGLHAVSLDEGRLLGLVEEFFIDPYAKSICGLQLKPRGLFARPSWYAIGQVERLGRDVIFLSSTAEAAPSGRGLRGFTGMPVTSKAGTNLGVLADLLVDERWLITHVQLRSGQQVALDPAQAVFGLDTVLLQADAAPFTPTAEEASRPSRAGAPDDGSGTEPA